MTTSARTALLASSLTTAVLALTPTLVAAQEAPAPPVAAPPAAPTPAAPTPAGPAPWRLDLQADVLLGPATDDGGLTLGGSLAAVFVLQGNGARVAALMTMGTRIEQVCDVSYVHRFALDGDDAQGLAFDLDVGLSAGEFGANANLFHDTPQLPSPGLHLGFTYGASLDYRASFFDVGVDLRGHTLAALDPRPTTSAWQLDLLLGLHLGVGFS